MTPRHAATLALLASTLVACVQGPLSATRTDLDIQRIRCDTGETSVCFSLAMDCQAENYLRVKRSVAYAIETPASITNECYVRAQRSVRERRGRFNF